MGTWYPARINPPHSQISIISMSSALADMVLQSLIGLTIAQGVQARQVYH